MTKAVPYGIIFSKNRSGERYEKILCLIFAAVITVSAALMAGCAGKTGGDDTKPAVTKDVQSVDQTVPADTERLPDTLPEANFNKYVYRIIGQGGAGWTAADMMRPETMEDDGLQSANRSRRNSVIKSVRTVILPMQRLQRMQRLRI